MFRPLKSFSQITLLLGGIIFSTNLRAQQNPVTPESTPAKQEAAEVAVLQAKYEKLGPNFMFSKEEVFCVNLHALSCMLSKLPFLEAKNVFMRSTAAYTNFKDHGGAIKTVRIGKFHFSAITLGTLLDLAAPDIESIVMIREYLGAMSSVDLVLDFQKSLSRDDQIKFLKAMEEETKRKQEAAARSVGTGASDSSAEQTVADLLKSLENAAPTPPQDPAAKPAPSVPNPAALVATPPGTQATVPAAKPPMKDQVAEALAMRLTEIVQKIPPGMKIFYGVSLRVRFKDGSFTVIRLKSVKETTAGGIFSQGTKSQEILVRKGITNDAVGIILKGTPEMDHTPIAVPLEWKKLPILSIEWDRKTGYDNITVDTASRFIEIPNAYLPEGFKEDLHEIEKHELEAMFGYFPLEFLADPWKKDYKLNWFERIFL